MWKRASEPPASRESALSALVGLSAKAGAGMKPSLRFRAFDSKPSMLQALGRRHAPQRPRRGTAVPRMPVRPQGRVSNSKLLCARAALCESAGHGAQVAPPGASASSACVTERAPNGDVRRKCRQPMHVQPVVVPNASALWVHA